ncbi:MAG: esterase/lipase family protein, partial [Betaproteobacteria bacterium]
MTLSALLRISLLEKLVAGTLAARWVLPDSAGWGGALLAGALLPVAGTAVVLALELAVAAVIDPRQPRIWPLQWLGVWLGETSCSVRAFAWRQPFAAGFAEPPLVHDPQRPAVLLIHGYVCNRAAWKPLLDSGRLADCNVVTINLQPVFGSIDRYADPIHAAVTALRAATGAARVVLVGHSMGGLAARAYLRRHGDAAVGRGVTLARPPPRPRVAARGPGANPRHSR